MRIAVIGAAGQLGTDLIQTLQHEVIALRHSDVEITDMDSVQQMIDEHRPDCVINAAAYNKVDQAEDEPEVAFANNALGPRNLAVACDTHGATFCHVSTDYVFGTDRNRRLPYRVFDAPGPTGAYGISKLAGEHFVHASCPKSFVIRTCGLYGHAARNDAGQTKGKGNFVETMLRLGAERDSLRIVSDQLCTPTSSLELARAISGLIETKEYGLHHGVNRGATSWADFAREIFRFASLDVDVESIPTSEYPTKANRPGYSVLDGSGLEHALGRPMPEWKTSLREYIMTRCPATVESGAVE